MESHTHLDIPVLQFFNWWRIRQSLVLLCASIFRCVIFVTITSTPWITWREIKEQFDFCLLVLWLLFSSAFPFCSHANSNLFLYTFLEWKLLFVSLGNVDFFFFFFSNVNSLIFSAVLWFVPLKTLWSSMRAKRVTFLRSERKHWSLCTFYTFVTIIRLHITTEILNLFSFNYKFPNLLFFNHIFVYLFNLHLKPTLLHKKTLHTTSDIRWTKV